MKKTNFNRWVIAGIFILFIIPFFQCSHKESAASGQKYTCGMHPQIISDEPGNCPICEMKLTPIKQKDQLKSNHTQMKGMVAISNPVQQNMNMQTVTIQRRDLQKKLTLNAVTKIDERSEYIISSKVSGWIEKLLVNYVGQQVRRGQKVMDIYSPELVAAQQEYLSAMAYQETLQKYPDSLLQQSGDALLKNSYRKLRFLEISEEDIRQLKTGKKPDIRLSYFAPANGFVIDKFVTEGQKINVGQPLLHVADLSTLWVIGDIYERDLSGVHLNDKAEIYLEAFPGKSLQGIISFISPVAEAKTRTVQIRIDLANPQYRIKPEMLARVELFSQKRKNVLAVPEEAVIRSGSQAVAVLADLNNTFKPVQLSLGKYADGYYEVLSGLSDNDRVVRSAQFLIDSESNLKSALDKFTSHQHGMNNHSNHSTTIDIYALDENNDGQLYECPMDWDIISDRPGNCSVCEMKLYEYSLDEIRSNLLEHGFQVKEMEAGHAK